MRLTRIRAADFRNLTFADVSTDAPRVFLLGDNGQGKTNLLEAAALVSSFRSFRTTDIAPLVRSGCTEARLRLDVRLSSVENAEIEIRLAKGSRKAPSTLGNSRPSSSAPTTFVSCAVRPLTVVAGSMLPSAARMPLISPQSATTAAPSTGVTHS